MRDATRPPLYTEPPRWRAIVLTFLVLVAALAPIPPLVRSLQTRTRGIVYGIPPRIPHTDVNPYAINVDLVPLDDADLARALRILQNAGFGWLRLRFPWHEIEVAPGERRWEQWDRVVEAARARGFRIIALVDGTPPWYRPPGEEDNPVVPPTDMDAFARFAADLARRYAGEIDYYQVWEQPNVTPFWGNERVDPAGYVAMLRQVGAAIREADNTAYIISAGLAPTPLHEPYNMSDVDYLDAMYRAGAKGTFDILGAKAFDLEGGDPWSRDYAPDRLGVVRLVLLREVMLRHGDKNTAMWVVGWGRHATPPNWQGRPSIWGTVTEEEQAKYVHAVYRRKRQEWPWLGLLTWDQFYPQVPPDDPLWGFALVRPDWRIRPVYQAFRALATGTPLVGTGRYGPRAWIWRFPDAQLRHTLLVEGTRIGIIADELVAVEASLDGEERSVLLDAGREHDLGKRLALEPHEVILRFDPPGVTTLLVGRDRPLGPYVLLGVLALVVVAALVQLATWALWPPTESLVLPGLLLVATGFYMVAPTLTLSLLALGLMAIIVFYRLDWGLVAVMAALPFVALPKRLGGWQFNLVETYVVLSALSWGARLVVGTVVAAAEPEKARWSERVHRAVAHLVGTLRPRTLLDVLVLVLVFVGAWAALGARYQDVAWREYRWVMVEPVLFYWMVRTRWQAHIRRHAEEVARTTRSWVRRRALFLAWEQDIPAFSARLVNGFLWGAGMAVLVGGIFLVLRPESAYAEGVWRLRGVYGSPNNMALILGRGVALALALAFLLPYPWGKGDEDGAERDRPGAWPRVLPFLSVRQGYAVMAVLLLLGLVGTFSRGALLVGLPVTFLFLGWVVEPRWRRWLVVGGVLVLLVQVPLLATERFRTLFTGSGTLALRVALWTSSLRMVRDFPWRGVGPDNFLYYFRETYLPYRGYPEPHLSHPHNVVLHFWLALGVPGLVWVLGTLWVLARRGRWLLSTLRAPSASRALVVGSLGMTVYGVAHGLVDQSFLLPDLMILFLFGVAVVASVEERVRMAG